MKWWYPYTKRLRYGSSKKIDEHNNKFGKRWSLGSEIMVGTNIYNLTKSRTNLSDYPFIKYDIFEANVNFPPRCTPIGIVTKYCEHRNI